MRIVVIGGGVVGASAAYHLARDGADVVLVDRGDRGQASAAGAGIVGPWLAGGLDDPTRLIAAAGARYYPDIVAALTELGETDLGHARTGGLNLVREGGDLDSVYERAKAAAAVEPIIGEVSRLDASGARALFPPLGDGYAAVHVEGTARVDGGKIRDALRRSALAHGAKERSGGAELTADGERTRVSVDGDVVDADAIVVAAGAWTPELCRPLGVELSVIPHRGQITHLAHPGVETDRWPVVLPPGPHYFLGFPDSRVVVGATTEPGAGFDYRVTAGGQAKVLNDALGVAPGLVDATLLETRVGFRPATPDGRPMLGRVRGDVLVATGMGPTGLTMGPYAGALVASAILGQTADFDLAPFDPLRS